MCLFKKKLITEELIYVRIYLKNQSSCSVCSCKINKCEYFYNKLYCGHKVFTTTTDFVEKFLLESGDTFLRYVPEIWLTDKTLIHELDLN